MPPPGFFSEPPANKFPPFGSDYPTAGTVDGLPAGHQQKYAV